MDGESAQQDYKLAYNGEDPADRLELVKNLVALANAGGGQLIFGRNDTEFVGLDLETLKALDSARLADFVDKFTTPAKLVISHEHISFEGDRTLCVVRVDAAAVPIVMADIGNYADKGGRTKSAFLKGDIWTRHGSRTERVTYEDIRQWIERARRDERETILGRINKVIDIPEGAEIQIVQPAVVPNLDTPRRMLEYAAKRRATNPHYVLSADDLVELFKQREQVGTQITKEELALIIASALRRPVTLFWWLILAEDAPELILSEITKCLDAEDRDKSDAAKSVIELAAIYADDEQLETIRTKLANSRYKHFREAVKGWSGRDAILKKFSDRITNSKFAGRSHDEMTDDELEVYATELAVLPKKTSTSRQLGDLTRVIWSRKTVYNH